MPQARRKVLIADDNVDAAVGLALLIQAMGHETQVAHDGPRTLELADEFQPHVAILDIGMPGLDGYEIARRLQERPWSGPTLLIAVTGWGTEHDRELTRRAGFHAHLIKPADLDQLAEIIAQVQMA